jgi:hypothetical protein
LPVADVYDFTSAFEVREMSGGQSKIEWTERTWNLTVGCTKISQGCSARFLTALV